MLDPIEHIIDAIIAYPDLAEKERAALRLAIEADPALAVLVACRQEIAASIDAVISGGTSDRGDFTLFSLYRAGRAGDLTAEERARVIEHADRFEQALVRHPGLSIASDDLAGAAAEFSDLWDERFDTDVDEHDAFAGDPGLADVQESADGRTMPAARPISSRRVRPSRTPAGPPRRGGAYRWVVRTSIAVAVVVFAFVVTQIADRDGGMLTVETGPGETRLVELGGGSEVRLQESSALSYAEPQSALNRRAELTGRAYFEIASEARGFLVETPTARVTVLGTTFGIDAQERMTEVVLTEGRLTLARSEKLDDLVVLEPGQMSRVVAGAGPTAPIAVDVPRHLSWTGLFIFKSTPLGEIAALLGDHFDVVITVDESLADERVTGTFEQSRPLGEILEVIASAVGATVRTRADGGYVITHP